MLRDFFVRIKKFIFPLGFATTVVVFVVAKLPFLSLPFYWDESWVYGPAVRTMSQNGLSILPGSLPVDLSRGHPLLFDFLGALWIRIFGTSLTASHVFPLTVSVLLLIIIYFFGKNIFGNAKIGFLAVLALCLQPIFLAQSGMLLPEVLLSLFSICAIYFYLLDKFFAYVFFAGAMLLTKESGIALIAALLFWNLIEVLKTKDKTFFWKNLFLKSFIVSIPLIPFLLFFIIQKSVSGWYFFPQHIAYISFHPSDVFKKLEKCFAYIFIYQGRNLLSFSIIISFAMILFRRLKVDAKKTKAVCILFLHILFFVFFSSVNFYSERYLHFAIPALVLIFSFYVNEVFIFRWTPVIATIVLICTQWQYINYRTNSDHNLGYADAVKVQQQAINYCIENNFRDKNIYTLFLMEDGLTNPFAGYVNEEQKFNHVNANFNSQTDYCIFSSGDDRNQFDRETPAAKLSLVKRFDCRNAFAEIYKMEK